MIVANEIKNLSLTNHPAYFGYWQRRVANLKGVLPMFGYNLAVEGRIAKKTEASGRPNASKMEQLAPAAFLKHFAAQCAFNIVITSVHLPRKVRQRACRLTEIAARKQAFWARLLSSPPCTAQARAEGRAEGYAQVTDFETA